MARKKRRDKEPRVAGGTTDALADGSASTLPAWTPWVLFAVLTLYLFRAFVFSDAMLVGNDTLSLGYVARAFFAEMLHRGIFPLWAPRLLGGTPFLEALSGGDSLYPPSLALLLILDPHRALGWKLVLHVFLAGIFMYGWVRSLGASRVAALVGGTGYMLAPFLVSLVHPGHDGKIFVTALAPLLFWAVERFFRKRSFSAFAGIALVVAMVIFTPHFQMAYFLFGAVGLYAAFRAAQLWKDGGGKRAVTVFALFLAASVTGAAGAAVQLIPSVKYVTEYSRRIQTTREAAGETGVAWSSSWSMHPEEAMSLIIPEFAGNNANGSAWTSGTYWGRNFFKDNHEYAGLVILLLAAVSFAVGARPGVRWFFTGLGLLAFLFAQGAHTPVWRIFYEVVPGIRLFRAPSQVMFLFGFSGATLAALGVDGILRARRTGDEKAWTAVQRILYGGAGLLLLLLVLAASGTLTSAWTFLLYRNMDPAKQQALQSLQPYLAQGAFIAAALAVFTAVLVWAFRRGMLPAAGFVAALLLLVTVDEARVDGSFIQTMDFYEWARPDGNIQALLDREKESGEPYRLLSLSRSGQDVKPSLYGIELAAGHHPNDLARYRELIGMVGSGFPRNLLNPNVRAILNVRYILWPDLEIGPAPEGPVVSRTALADGRTYQTLLADAGLPRARLVGKAVVKADGEAVPYILSRAFDPEGEVVLAEDPPVALDGGPVTGAVTWEERTPNRLRLRVRSDRPALLVIGDNWFPAWKARVNGAPVPVLRANYTLRAVPVPAGEDIRVEMRYHSSTLTASAWVSAVVLLLLLVGGGVSFWRERRG
ncbi:MAG: hypothetical protein ACE5GJ_03980 [Gemmatimonadota bacterium]